MTIHIPIGGPKSQLSTMVAAMERGEEVVLDKAGKPVAKLVPVVDHQVSEAELEAIAERRKSAFGMYRDAFKGFDTSIEAIKAERGDPEERFRRKFGPID